VLGSWLMAGAFLAALVAAGRRVAAGEAPATDPPTSRVW
jgi:hypothetical protein